MAGVPDLQRDLHRLQLLLPLRLPLLGQAPPEGEGQAQDGRIPAAPAGHHLRHPRPPNLHRHRDRAHRGPAHLRPLHRQRHARPRLRVGHGRHDLRLLVRLHLPLRLPLVPRAPYVPQGLPQGAAHAQGSAPQRPGHRSHSGGFPVSRAKRAAAGQSQIDSERLRAGEDSFQRDVHCLRNQAGDAVLAVRACQLAAVQIVAEVEAAERQPDRGEFPNLQPDRALPQIRLLEPGHLPVERPVHHRRRLGALSGGGAVRADQRLVELQPANQRHLDHPLFRRLPVAALRQDRRSRQAAGAEVARMNSNFVYHAGRWFELTYVFCLTLFYIPFL